MSWYKDRAKDNIQPAVGLGASNGVANAAKALAKIPLDIDKRRVIDEKLEIEKQKLLMDKYIADQRLKGQGVAANGKVAAAQLGFKGREASAFARMYDADVQERNNTRTNNMEHDKMEYGVIKETIKGANQKDVAKINKSAKDPTQTRYIYDKDGNKVKEVKEPYASVDFDIDTKRKNMAKIDLSTKGK